jgi:hypothetical protein
VLTPAQEAKWSQLADEVFTGMKEWRLQHPRATWREIEAALDERLAVVRARMLQDVALASAATDLVASGERPVCPGCGRSMQVDGQRRRHLTTSYDQEITLSRSYAQCPVCQTGVFPPR